MLGLILLVFDLCLFGLTVASIVQVVLITRNVSSPMRKRFLIWARDSGAVLSLLRLSNNGILIFLFVGLCFSWRLPIFIWRYYFSSDPSSAMGDQARLLLMMMNTAVILMIRRFYQLMVLNFDKFISLQEEANDKKLLLWKPPLGLGFVQRQLLRFLTTKSAGVDRLPPGKGKKLLFVSNHLLGPFDHPLFVAELSTKTGIHPRGVVSTNNYYNFLGVADFLDIIGTVPLDKAHLFIERGDPVVIYAGKKEEDSFEWARGGKGFDHILTLALKHDYKLVPCSCVGRRDVVDMIYKVGDTSVSSLSGAFMKWLQKSTKHDVWMWFGEPFAIDKEVAEKGSADEKLTLAKQNILDAVEDGMGELWDMMQTEKDIGDALLKNMRHSFEAALRKSG